MTTKELHEAKLIERAYDAYTQRLLEEGVSCPSPRKAFEGGYRAGYDEGLKWQDNARQRVAAQVREMLDAYQDGQRGLPSFAELIDVMRVIEGEPILPFNEVAAAVVAQTDAAFKEMVASTASEMLRDLAEDTAAPSSVAMTDEGALHEKLAELLRSTGWFSPSDAQLNDGGLRKAIPKIRALTGAAPADANVGDQDEAGDRLDAICDAYESGAAHGLKRDGLRNGYDYHADKDCAYAYTIGYEAGEERTAPEPSAPADKVDAERYRVARSLAFRQISSDGAWVVIRLPQDDAWQAQDAAADFDAAIDRMRSESGKGGKL